jgi:hypothetical protein
VPGTGGPAIGLLSRRIVLVSKGSFSQGCPPLAHFVAMSIQENKGPDYMTKVIYTTPLDFAEILPKAWQIPPVDFFLPIPRRSL